MGFPGGSVVRNLAANARDAGGDSGSIPGSGRSLRKGNGSPTPVFLPEKSHGQRSMAGYRPWACKMSDMIERLNRAQTRMAPHLPS